MRRIVPFIGEQQIARADNELERAKRSSGRVIDEVVGDGDAESSWEDVVASDKPGSAAKPHQSGVGITRPDTNVATKNKSLVKGSAPSVRYTASNNNSVSAEAKNKTSVVPSTRTTTLLPSGAQSLEWVATNSGRGLRISVTGNIDHGLRDEWRRLLEETEGNGASEFEFNLTQSPSLSLTGLGMLLLFKERKASRREDIQLSHCSKEVAQLLKWTGMEKYFVVYASHKPDDE